MKVAIVKFETEEPKTSIIVKQDDTEEIRADSITIRWQPYHIVFNLVHQEKTSRVTHETIIYRASDVLSIHMFEE